MTNLDEIRERAVSVSQGAYRVVRAEDFDALIAEVERLLAQRILSNEDFARSFDMGLAAGERRERASVVAWLRSLQPHNTEVVAVYLQMLADVIERGGHRREEKA